MNWKKNFMVLFCLSFTLIAFPSMAQNKIIQLNLNNATLSEAIRSIELQSDYRFVYDNTVPLSKRVTMQIKDRNISNILVKLFDHNSISYEITENQIILKIVRQGNQSPALTIKGKIVDTSGESVIGATVVVKDDATKGTVTDYDGNFSLNDVPQNAVLSISYVGYQSMEFPATSPQLAHIVLTEDSKFLEEVVVVGYGTQKKINLTGAVSSISGKELNDRPVVSAAAALQGADPSINLTLNTGSPAAGYSMNIRGVMSVNGGSPLILVDGIESSLSQVNPNDIDNISVLKDASSSAIYGAKASSGVVLITTKKGSKSDKAKITYSGRYGISQNTTSTDFIRNGYDHVNIVNLFYKVYQGRNMLNYSDDDLQELLARKGDLTEDPSRPWTKVADNGNYLYYGNTDWYKYFYNTSRPQHEHNVSLTGGNEKINYYVSGRYLSQDGIFKIYPDKYENLSFRVKLGAQLRPWLRYAINTNYNTNEYDYAGYRDEHQTIHSLQSNINSAFVPYNPDGTIVQYTNQLAANSPIGAGHGGYLTANTARNNRGTEQLTLANQFDIDLFEGLVLTASHSFRNYRNLNTHRNLPFQYSRKQGTLLNFTSGTIYNEYRELHYNSKLNSINVFATYSKLFNDVHNFTAVAGTQFDDFRGVENELIQRDLLNDNISSFSVATGEAQILQSIGAYATLGYFGRVNYDYKGKYLLEASGRYDGSSRFSPDHRWGFFPSASFGWRISEEDFWAPLRGYWENAKVRFSYGSLGNQQVNNYSYFDQISTDKTMAYTFCINPPIT